MIYMFNATFDSADGVESIDGRFNHYGADPQDPLKQSPVWFKQTNAADPSPKPDNPNDWELVTLTPGSKLRLNSRNGGDQVWVRISAAGVLTNFCARMTTVITRHARGATVGTSPQQRASPFPLGDTNQSCVVFDTGNQPQSDSSSWVQHLGAATLTTSPTGIDCYRMIVAATVGSLGEGQELSGVRTYSHDPEFDVDGGA